ncbi:hypothetical protein HK097_005428, partial [Rhizophlyctis rosea]
QNNTQVSFTQQLSPKSSDYPSHIHSDQSENQHLPQSASPSTTPDSPKPIRSHRPNPNSSTAYLRFRRQVDRHTPPEEVWSAFLSLKDDTNALWLLDNQNHSSILHSIRSLPDHPDNSLKISRCRTYLESLYAARIAPGPHLYAEYIRSKGIRTTLDDALNLLAEMKSHAVKPTPHIFNIIIRNLRRGQRPDLVPEILPLMRKENVMPDSHIYAQMIRTLILQNRLSHAEVLFEEVRREGAQLDSPCWGYLIEEYAKRRDAKRVYELYSDLQSAGKKPDSRVYASLIGIELKVSNNPEKAFSYLDEALKANEVNGTCYHFIIRHLCGVRDLLKAEAYLNQAMEQKLLLPPKLFQEVDRAFKKEGFGEQAAWARRMARSYEFVLPGGKNTM